MAVDELDGIFDGDDVTLPLLVDLVDHRGEGRALARSGRPGDEHQPARTLGHLPDDIRKLQLIERLDVERDLPDDHRHAAALLEAVAAEAREVLDAEREVELVLHLEALLLVLGEHRVRELQRVLGRHHELEVRVLDLAVDAQLGPLAGGDVQIGRVALDHLLEQDAEVDAWSACAGAVMNVAGETGVSGSFATLREAVGVRMARREMTLGRPEPF